MDQYSFMDRMLNAFPDAVMDCDDEGQLIINTNWKFLTDNDNPSIPAGEWLVINMETGEAV
jgi:hypothetical protein